MALDTNGSIVGVARVSALTSGTAGVTTQDITDSNFGDTPNAVRLFACLASANNTVADGAVFAYGMSDGTDSGCIAIWSEDQTGTANANCGRVARDRVMHLPDDTGTIVLSLSFDSFISNGARFTYETIPGTAYYIVAVFYKAETVKVGYTATDATIGVKVDVTSVGAQPNVMHFASNALAVTSSDVTGTHGAMSMGLAVDNGTTLEFGYKLTSWKDNVATTECGQVQTNTAICGTGLPSGTVITASSTAKIVDLDSSGFSFETVATGANKVLWMALEFADVDVELVEYDTGNITGNVSDTEAGFGPQFIECIMSEMNGSLGSKADGSTGPIGMGFATEDNEFSVSACHRDGQTIPDTGSLVDTQFHVLRRNVVATTGMQATGPSGSGSFDVDGFTLNFSSEVGGNKDWLTLVIQERAQVITPPLGVLESVDQAPHPFTPVASPLGVLETEAQSPTPTIPVTVGLGVQEAVGQVPHPFTPIPSPVGTLEAVGQVPHPFTPVPSALGVLEATGAVPEPFTPIPAPLGTLEAVGTPPDPVTPVGTPLGILEVAGQVPHPFTPIGAPLGTLELSEIVPAPFTPVPAPLGTLEAVGQAPHPFTPVAAPLGVEDLVGLAPTVEIPTVYPSPPLGILEMAGQVPDPITPIDPPLGVLEVVGQAPDPITPILTPLGTVEMVAQVPQVISPITTILSTLELAGFLPTVSAAVVGCFKRIRNVVMTKLSNDFTDAFSYPTVYDNMFTSVAADGVWARAAVIFQGSKQLEVGASQWVFRKSGMLEVHLFAPIESGSHYLTEAVDRIATLFRGQEIQSVKFRAISVQNRGAALNKKGESKWWRIDIQVPFVSDVSIDPLVGSGSDTMVSFDELHDACNTRFKVEVADARSVTAQYDNFPFTPPADDTWVRFTVLPGESSLISTGDAGDNRYRTPGMAVASVFVPIESGIDSSYTLVDQIADAFRAVTDSGVTFMVPRVITIGRSGNWWQTNVELPFYADTIA